MDCSGSYFGGCIFCNFIPPDAKKIVIFYIWGFSVLFTRYDDIRCTKHTGTLYVVVVVVMVLGSSRWYSLWQRAVQTHHMDSNHWYVIERKSTRTLTWKEKMIIIYEMLWNSTLMPLNYKLLVYIYIWFIFWCYCERKIERMIMKLG